MAIGDVLRLSAVWNDLSNSNEQVNVFHFRQEDILVFDTPAEDLGQRFIDEVVPFYVPCVSSSYFLRTVQVRTFSTPPEGLDISLSSGNQGTLSGTDNLPRQMCPIVTWRTPFLGRSYRGRTFLPTITETHQDDGRLSTAFQGLMSDFVNAVLGMVGVSVLYAPWALVVHSVELGVDTPVTNYTLQPIMGVQRRRKFGQGS